MNSTPFVDIQQSYLAEDVCAAWILCDQHALEATAYTLVDADSRRVVTYGELRRDSIRLAHAFRDLGVGPGTRIATLLHEGHDLVTTILAVWRLGAVHVPLFTAFAGKAIEFRLKTADVELIVTDPGNRPKLPSGLADRCSIVMADGLEQSGDFALTDLIENASTEDFDSYAQGPDGPLVHIFTSGTTGSPKEVIHPLKHAAGWQSYLVYGLDVTAEDVYWCAADPGWAYGLYPGIVSPLAQASGVIIQCGAFDPVAARDVIEREGVTNFTAAPTVYRALRNRYPTVPSKGKLRQLSSAGEPLTPEVNVWANAELGLDVRDHFGQTEVGMVFGNSHHPTIAKDVVRGSMGYPFPGWEALVIGENDSEEKPAGEVGRIAIDVEHSPAMTFRTYQDSSKTAWRFAGDGQYYLLGDLGHRDATGFHFASRDDDVVIMAGYRINAQRAPGRRLAWFDKPRKRTAGIRQNELCRTRLPPRHSFCI